ncbi:MAG: hypothetical protein QJR02_10140 [Sinobacteraceae bacterium]|nr:hypothetical protein [Nevskiaceae bacterium]
MPLITQQTFFSSGELWGIDSDALSTPSRFGTLQDVSIDFTFTQKELRGQNLFAEKVANSEGKIMGKAKFGRIDLVMFNNLYFGNTITSGRIRTVSKEAAAIPSATPWQVTVANAANFRSDLGVTDVTTGKRMEKVASTPATGQYSVSTGGVYTFASADANKAILIDYTYNDTTSGRTVSVVNTPSGLAPTFQVILREKDDSGEFGIQLLSCVSSKLTLASKLGDYMIPEFDFAAFANASGQIANIFGE